jgi:hypothetical protein
MPTYPGAPANKLSVVGPTVSIPPTLHVGADGSVTAPVTVVDTALPVLQDLTTSVVAGPVAAVGAKAVRPVSAVGVSPGRLASADAARVSQHVADGLFAALGGAVDAAELAVLGSGGASGGAGVGRADGCCRVGSGQSR